MKLMKKSNFFHIWKPEHWRKRNNTESRPRSFRSKSTKNFENLSLHSFFDIKVRTVSIKCGSLEWYCAKFNFLVQWPHSSEKSQFAQKLLAQMRWPLHGVRRSSQRRQGSPIPLTWGCADGNEWGFGLVGWERFFSCLAKYGVRTPSIAGQHPPPSFPEHATSSYFSHKQTMTFLGLSDWWHM